MNLRRLRRFYLLSSGQTLLCEARLRSRAGGTHFYNIWFRIAESRRACKKGVAGSMGSARGIGRAGLESFRRISEFILWARVQLEAKQKATGHLVGFSIHGTCPRRHSAYRYFKRIGFEEYEDGPSSMWVWWRWADVPSVASLARWT